VGHSRRTIRVAGKGKERTVFFGSRAARRLRKHLRGQRKGPLILPELLRQTGCIHAHNEVRRLHGRDDSGRTVHAHKSSTYPGINLTWRQPKLRAQQLVRKGKLFCAPQSRHLQTQAVARVMRSAALRAGLARITPQIIRRSFATHLLPEGADIRHMQGLLGHTALITTQINTRVASTEPATLHCRFHPRSRHVSTPTKSSAVFEISSSIRTSRRGGHISATVVDAKARFIADAEDFAQHPSSKDAVLLR
jgi:site-specific recombinase XerD